MKTPEDYAEQILKSLRLKVGTDVNEHAIPNISKLFREYASQFKPPAPLPTHEEIGKYAKQYLKQEYSPYEFQTLKSFVAGFNKCISILTSDNTQQNKDVKEGFDYE